MGNIEIFKNSSFGEVRVARNENGDPLFCLADVCAILDLQTNKVKERLNPDGWNTIPVIDAIGRTQQATFISEPNLYKAIFQSRKQEAEQFTDWVTSEVLPSIRKTGGYIMTKEDDTEEMIIARGMLAAKSAIERQQRIIEEQKRTNSILQANIEANKPKLDYYNEVLKASNGHTITTIAAFYNMSAVTLNRLLLLGKVIRKTGREYSVMAKYQGENIAKPEKFKYVNKEGEECTKNDLRWTKKGQALIHEKIKNAIAAGALVTVKGRYQISQKWLDSYLNAKKSKQSQSA